VNCNFTSNIQYSILSKSSNNYWFSLQLRNVNLPIATVEVLIPGTSNWITGERMWYDGGFTFSSSVVFK
jgi:expansin (peptidoglycan-binding protein)